MRGNVKARMTVAEESGQGGEATPNTDANSTELGEIALIIRSRAEAVKDSTQASKTCNTLFLQVMCKT